MIKDLQKLIAEKGNGYCALIISPENRKYFTGFESSDGFLLVSANKNLLVESIFKILMITLKILKLSNIME
mgnify:CR=1 FL=1